jgi:hypothetical protein
LLERVGFGAAFLEEVTFLGAFLAGALRLAEDLAALSLMRFNHSSISGSTVVIALGEVGATASGTYFFSMASGFFRITFFGPLNVTKFFALEPILLQGRDVIFEPKICR